MTLPATASAIRSGFGALRANPLRTMLSALGVVIGIGAMIAVLALSDGVERSFRDRLALDGRAQTLRISARTMDFVDGLVLARSDAPELTLDDAVSLEGAVGALGSVDLSTGGQALVTVAPGRPARGVTLRGVRVPPAMLRSRPLIAGRFFTPAEVRDSARLLVISDGLAAALATMLVDSTAGPVTRSSAQSRPRPVTDAPDPPQPTAAACRALVGRPVTIRDQPWTILGILPPLAETDSACTGRPRSRTTRTAAFNLAGRLSAMVPVTAVAAAATPTAAGGFAARQPSGRALTLVATRLEDFKPMRERAESWLATKFGRPVADTGGWKARIDVASYEQESEGITQAMLIFRLLMSAITGISLVVGGVGIMNVLLASVTERTREIGISKAVGARRRDVLVQYLAESVAISLMGAVLGTALGYGVAQIVAAVMRSRATIPVHAGFSLSTLLVAIGAPLVVGVLFGMYPALRASRLSPIDAIRHE